uniref:Terpene synthase n=1 Tax=Bionectria ochroleuca TaxID=29856 RepID=A0A8H7TQZ5_BIOOC
MADEIDDLLNRLSGKELHVPDLLTLLGNWQTDINSHLGQLRSLVRPMLEAVINNPEKISKVIDCDFALLACLICPNAGWEEIQSFSVFLIWIFVWDDDLGLADPDIADVSRALPPEGNGEVKMRSPFPIMDLFDKFGSSLVNATDQVHRRRLFAEIEFYISEVVTEHARQHDRALPNVDEYLQMRMGTSGMLVFLAFSDYMNKMRLPEWIMQAEEMNTLKNETTKLAMFVNDIYSLQKEIMSGAPQNILPLLLNTSSTKTLDECIDELTTMICVSVQKFEEVLCNLDAATGEDRTLHNSLHVYADNCRTLVTGLIEWSKKTRRYSLGQYEVRGGGFKIPL